MGWEGERVGIERVGIDTEEWGGRVESGDRQGSGVGGAESGDRHGGVGWEGKCG